MTTPTKYNRRPIRLEEYDYTQAGAYFVTICAAYNESVLACRGEACLALNSNSKSDSDSTNIFGHIDNGEIVLNDLGRIVERRWHALPEHHTNVELDEFVVMPNHVHFIICIDFMTHDDDRARQASPLQTTSLGTVVGSFKSSVTRHINEYRGAPGAKIWQRNYYEHIIRSESELNRIRKYITDNPLHWDTDVAKPGTLL